MYGHEALTINRLVLDERSKTECNVPEQNSDKQLISGVIQRNCLGPLLFA